MRYLARELREQLEQNFGERVTFDDTERVLYGHDIASMPSLVKPLIGDTTPHAVVQPRSEDEILTLVRWAREQGIRLVVRGKATSGYGGVLPVKGGVVVDLWHMKSVLAVGEDTVTVEPGISWEQLDGELLGHGRTLRLYPTSYPSSTVGGWLAQGGAGIGSYQFGYFPENVVSARVVAPDGEVRSLSGDDLELVADAEGITGIITRVELRTQAADAIRVKAFGTADPRGLQSFIRELDASSAPIWSVQYVNPTMAEMKNRAPPAEHFGEPAEPRVVLPESYILLVVYREQDADAVAEALSGVSARTAMDALPEEIAKRAWEHRFKIMQFKRLGPSIVPAEVIVPLDRFAEFLEKLGKQVRQPVLMEGVVIARGRGGKPEVVVLGFVPADQRRFAFNIAFGITLAVTAVAESVGGRAYATGLYFSSRADQVLGEARVRKLRELKRSVDPKRRFNPGKVIDRAPIARLIGLAAPFTPLIRIIANRLETRIGERFDHERNPTGTGTRLGEDSVRGIPADVAWYAYACSQCGYCVNECDQFYGRGWESQSPRGKWFWLREYMEGRADWSKKMVDSFLICTTCELCNRRCSSALPIEPSWMKLRGSLVHEQGRPTFPPFEMMAASLEAQGDIWAGYRSDRDDWFPKDLRERHGQGKRAKAVYFAGCTASYVEHDIGIASVRLLDEAGVDFAYLGQAEQCCGTPMLCSGKWDLFERIMRENIEAVKAAGADTVISSCPACDLMWRTYYPRWAEGLGIAYGIRARHYTEVVAERLDSGKLSFPDRSDGNSARVTWHDSCHMGRASGIYEPPRTLIKALPGVQLVEMAHNREDAHCCGSVLSLIGEPRVAADLGRIRLDEASEAGAEKVLAACPCCEFQFRVAAGKKDVKLEIQDLAHLAAARLGYELPDPHPEVRRQWAVFEGMIDLMTPEGFAGLMKDMLPEMVEAMPWGMGRMMRAMARVPGGLETMRPLFPVLFPRLLPMMMPALMPSLLKRVQERIPMPDCMAEQMPDLMPRVMENLMPHMIRDVVPLVAEPLIDHMHARAGRAA